MQVEVHTISEIPRKQTVELTTNITPKQMKRRIQIDTDVPLRRYIELYEQIFDIDLYAYRVGFLASNGHMIETLQDILADGNATQNGQQTMKEEEDQIMKVQIIVEAVGG